MKPINIVIIVITTIEALRAFDLAYITNGGRSPLELLSTLITNTAISESDRIGFGPALRLPDALVVATALVLGAEEIVTTDAGWPSLPVRVSVLP